MSRIKKEAGLTLIEVLAVLTIISFSLAVISLTSWDWFHTINNLPSLATNQEKLRFTVSEITKSIENSQVITCSPCDGSKNTEIIETADSKYQYDSTAKKIILLRNGNTLNLCDNVTSFIIEYKDNIYYITATIEQNDLKTNEDYVIKTSGKPINW